MGFVFISLASSADCAAPTAAERINSCIAIPDSKHNGASAPRGSARTRASLQGSSPLQEENIYCVYSTHREIRQHANLSWRSWCVCRDARLSQVSRRQRRQMSGDLQALTCGMSGHKNIGSLLPRVASYGNSRSERAALTKPSF